MTDAKEELSKLFTNLERSKLSKPKEAINIANKIAEIINQIVEIESKNGNINARIHYLKAGQAYRFAYRLATDQETCRKTNSAADFMEKMAKTAFIDIADNDEIENTIASFLFDATPVIVAQNLHGERK